MRDKHAKIAADYLRGRISREEYIRRSGDLRRGKPTRCKCKVNERMKSDG